MTVRDLKELAAYWQNGSDYDWKTALSLFRDRRYPYTLFMAHLAVEKLLKGLLVKETKDHAPFTHNLVYLAGKLSLELSKERIALLEEMNEFNIEARYPDEQKMFYKRATKTFASGYLKRVGELRTWLRNQF